MIVLKFRSQHEDGATCQQKLFFNAITKIKPVTTIIYYFDSVVQPKTIFTDRNIFYLYQRL